MRFWYHAYELHGIVAHILYPDRSKAYVRLPYTAYTHVIHNPDTPANGEYISIVEALDDYGHRPAQNEDELMASLAQIARFHAYFQSNPAVLADAKVSGKSFTQKFFIILEKEYKYKIELERGNNVLCGVPAFVLSFQFNFLFVF